MIFAIFAMFAFMALVVIALAGTAPVFTARLVQFLLFVLTKGILAIVIAVVVLCIVISVMVDRHCDDKYDSGTEQQKLFTQWEFKTNVWQCCPTSIFDPGEVTNSSQCKSW